MNQHRPWPGVDQASPLPSSRVPITARAVSAMFETPNDGKPAFYIHQLPDGNLLVIPGVTRQVRVNREMTGTVLDATLRFLKMSDEDRAKALAIVCSRLPAVTAHSLGIPFEEGP